MSFSRATSDSYVGYVWQFNEKSGFLGKEMEQAKATILIKKTGTLEGKETNVKMTYIHTYSKVSGSVTFSMDSTGKAAARLTLTETQDQWQIAIDIPGIKY